MTTINPIRLEVIRNALVAASEVMAVLDEMAALEAVSEAMAVLEVARCFPSVVVEPGAQQAEQHHYQPKGR